MPSTSFSGAIGDRGEELFLRRVGGQLEVARLHPGLGRGLLLQVDVDVRGGVVADEDGGEAHMTELGDRGSHLLAHLRTERLAVDDGCRHWLRA
jgi:hypothetical protein